MADKNKKIPFNNINNAPVNAVSPLNKDQIHEGIEGIDVKLRYYPNEHDMKKTLAKMVNATIGSDINEEISEEVGEELFEGGLQTGLDVFWIVFEVSGVSRACTHQLVRSSRAKFHQQSSRYTNMGDKFNVRMPQTIADNDNTMVKKYFEDLVGVTRNTYNYLIENGIPFQDARFACPIGLETYIICEYSLREFISLYSYRACPMFQWEITYVVKRMKDELMKVYPWIEQYIKISCEKNQKCTFQGWENTDGVCDFPWNAERVFKSQHFKPKN